MSSMQISAVIIVKNAEQTLQTTLESLERLPEVVVYDNGSRDRTLEIAGAFPNVSIHTGEFMGFGPTKNHAATLAKNDWILSIDADESVKPELMENIFLLNPENRQNIYAVHRHNYLMGKRVRHSGWGHDWLPRLYYRGTTTYSDAMVHENVLLPKGSREVKLQGELTHDAVREIGDFLVKINRYTEIRRHYPQRRHTTPMIFVRSLWSFLHTYFLRAGCLDGWRGLVIAVSNAIGVFFKYMKPFADTKIVQEQQQRAATDSE